jgi:hypothetical protein
MEVEKMPKLIGFDGRHTTIKMMCADVASQL